MCVSVAFLQSQERSVGCQSRPVMSHYVLLSLSLSTSFAPRTKTLLYLCTVLPSAGLLQCLLDIVLPLLDETKRTREWPAAHIPSQTLKHSQFHVHPSKKAGEGVRSQEKWSEQSTSVPNRRTRRSEGRWKSQPSQRGASHNNFSTGDNDTYFKTVPPWRHSLFHSAVHVEKKETVVLKSEKERELCLAGVNVEMLVSAQTQAESI